MCFDAQVYIPLLTERQQSGYQGYKHVAPLEQEPALIKMTFRAKKLEI